MMNNNTIDITKFYDEYGDFLAPVFFHIKYDFPSSKYFLNMPVEEVNEELTNQIIGYLNLEEKELNLYIKKWIPRHNYQTSSVAQDFANEYIFVSEKHALVVSLTILLDRVNIEFFFDTQNKELENWVLARVEKLKEELKVDKEPKFQVLCHNGNFYTQEVKINVMEVDVKQSYNDDFREIHELIQSGIEADTSGLILMHGIPGTGKTSYIKHLIHKHQETKFIFVPNDFVHQLLQPNFVSFLMNNKNAILVIEDAEKVIVSRENENQGSVVSTILQLTDGLFSDYLNIKIICTFNTDISKVDKALLRKGRMLAFYEFKALEAKKANALLEEIGEEPKNKSMTLADIYNLSSKGFEKEEQAIGFL